MTAIQILPYSISYKQAVADLVLPIQQKEFGIAITLADQPDLTAIDTFFKGPKSGFWLAVDEHDRVVGTVGLKLFAPQSAALRKMFVHPDCRGTGVAPRLLAAAVQHGIEQGLQKIYLGTTQAYKAAHRFYANHDFREIDAASLPAEFPRVAVDTRFFVRTIKAA